MSEDQCDVALLAWSQCTCKVYTEDNNLTLQNCIVGNAIGLLAFCNLIPLVTMVLKHYRFKKSFKLWILSKKTYVFAFMISLNICLFINYTFNIPHEHFWLKNSFYIQFGIHKGCATYMIVYFVFRKASKKDIDKQKWLTLIKCIFILSCIANIQFVLYNFIAERTNQ